VVALLGGALVSASSASASHESSAGSPSDFAVGSAKNRLAEFTPFPFQLEVSAHKRSESDTTGHVRGSGELPIGEFRVEGEVTCLRVESKPPLEAALTGPGYRASIKYRFKNTSGSAAPPENGGVEVYIEDNGRPVNGDPVDANGTGAPLPPGAFEAANPRACSDPNVAGQPYNPVDQGDYTVHDGISP
jgi:hypothetical protein